MFDYLIVVNDNGEMQTITSLEIALHSKKLDSTMIDYLNRFLVYRSAQEGIMEMGTGIGPDANIGSVAPDTET